MEAWGLDWLREVGKGRILLSGWVVEVAGQ